MKSMDHDTCVVRYVGYGNEEEVYLSELLPSEGKFARQRQTEQAKRENVSKVPNMSMSGQCARTVRLLQEE